LEKGKGRFLGEVRWTLCGGFLKIGHCDKTRRKGGNKNGGFDTQGGAAGRGLYRNPDTAGLGSLYENQKDVTPEQASLGSATRGERRIFHMDLIVGFLVGYVLGAKGGHEKFEELKEAWQTITNTEEFQNLMMAGLSLVNRVGQQDGSDAGWEARPITERIGELLGAQLSQIIAAVTEIRKAA
jgi:hypothetical protein